MAGNGKYNFSASFFLLYQIVTLIRKKKICTCAICRFRCMDRPPALNLKNSCDISLHIKNIIIEITRLVVSDDEFLFF